VSPSQFPWRPLGQLLVDRGLLTQQALDRALAEQRRTGRMLGQVLVWGGYVSAQALALALAEQHGVGVRSTAAAEAPARRADPGPKPVQWRPLGRVLVEKGFVTELAVERVLFEQRRHPGRRLGELLVSGDYITGPQLALALAEQHGVEIESEAELGSDLETVLVPAAAGEAVYHVRTAVYTPAYSPGPILLLTASFLEAADFACEYVQRERPDALEIEKLDGLVRETVWTYSAARAAAN
jgi:hypothetical protein